MDEESSLAERASSETMTGSSTRNNVSEKVSLMTEIPKKQNGQHFWKRHLLAFFIHLTIFLIYSTLALLALDSRSKTVQQNRNLLYCTFIEESAGDPSDT